MNNESLAGDIERRQWIHQIVYFAARWPGRMTFDVCLIHSFVLTFFSLKKGKIQRFFLFVLFFMNYFLDFRQ